MLTERLRRQFVGVVNLYAGRPPGAADGTGQLCEPRTKQTKIRKLFLNGDLRIRRIRITCQVFRFSSDLPSSVLPMWQESVFGFQCSGNGGGEMPKSGRNWNEGRSEVT